MRKFEEMIDDIRKIAAVLKSKHGFSSPFEIDELVNEAWIGYQRTNLSSESYIKNRAKWDMLDYIRDQIGRERKLKRGNFSRVKFITNMHTHYEDGEEIVGTIFDKPLEDKNLLNLENEELLIKLLIADNIKDEELRALFHYHFQQITLKDAASIMNRSEAHLCKLVKKALQKSHASLRRMEIKAPLLSRYP